MGPRKHVLDGGAHWRNRANMIEPSMCGGDAAFLSNYFDHCDGGVDSGSALVSINAVTLRRVPLVLGCVNVFGYANHLRMQQATQVNSAWPSLTGTHNEYQPNVKVKR